MFDNETDFFVISSVGGSGPVGDMDYVDLINNMDLVSSDMDDAVDFSSINVSELMAYNKT